MSTLASRPERLELREQFDTPEQQREAATLGMWIFLITEVLFFGGLFTAYMVYRSYYPGPFARASATLSTPIGALNTVVLLCSSFTMALAVRSAQLGRRRMIVLFLIVTMIFGGVFLGVKAYEWHEKFVERHVPGADFHLEGETMQGHAQLFFSLYFAMTGLHAVHMVIGIGILTTIAIFAHRGRYSSDYYSPVDVAGLYWHFVDIVWIFLFPLLYLIDKHIPKG